MKRESQVQAEGGETSRDGASNSAACAGNQRNATGQLCGFHCSVAVGDNPASQAVPGIDVLAVIRLTPLASSPPERKQQRIANHKRPAMPLLMQRSVFATRLASSQLRGYASAAGSSEVSPPSMVRAHVRRPDA